MLAEPLFILGSLAVLPFWLLMIILPRWSWTPRIIASPFIVVPPALCYLLMLITALVTPSTVPFTPDLNGIAALLATPVGAAAAWLHLLTFDLFVGRWVYLESRKRQIHALLTSIILVCVLLAGPLGFLLFSVAKRFGNDLEMVKIA